MSYKATAWAYDMPLRGSCKPVLVALADFADEAGSCYPGQDKLCAMTGLSLRTVRRALQRLEELGLIGRTARHDDRGYRTSDRYVLALDTVLLPATVTSGQNDPLDESRQVVLPVTVSTPTGHSDRANRTFGSIEPSDEPSETLDLKIEPPTEPARLLFLAPPQPTFDDFWAAYPRHNDRPAAERAWNKALRRVTAATILEGVRKHATDPNRTQQFTRYPATWLNADGWNDDPLPARTNTESPTQRAARMRAETLAELDRMEATNGNTPWHNRTAISPRLA